MPKTHVKRNWVFTPSQDFTETGSLQLGQILEDPYQPASALIPHETLKPPPTTLRDTTHKIGVNIHLHDSLNASYALWLQSSQLPIGAETSGHTTSSANASYRIDHLVSKSFVPSLAYVNQSLTSGDVASKTQWWKARSRIYIVTGLRIANGTTFDKDESDASGLQGSMEGDGTQSGVPAKGGMQGSVAQESGQSEEAKMASPFVFAYRLQQVRYRLTVTHKPFEGGNTVHAGEEREERREEDEGYDGFALVKIDEEDFDEGVEVKRMGEGEEEEAFLVKRD